MSTTSKIQMQTVPVDKLQLANAVFVLVFGVFPTSELAFRHRAASWAILAGQSKTQPLVYYRKKKAKQPQLKCSAIHHPMGQVHIVCCFLFHQKNYFKCFSSNVKLFHALLFSATFYSHNF